VTYPVGTLLEKPTLPELRWKPTRAKSSRRGVDVRLVWNHRWAGGTIDSVIGEFLVPANEKSSTIVYAGEVGPDAGRCVQMISLADKPWTQSELNGSAVSIEAADAIWLGHDPHGFSRLARMNAWLLHELGLPATWVTHAHIASGRGFTRHADGGTAAGGHTQCPTTNLALWHQFGELVHHELRRGHLRHVWAR
jgi:hypothetical protein